MDSGQIADPEVQLMAAVASSIRGDYVREGVIDPWLNSPFAWIKALPPGSKGRVGEQLVAGWCAAKDFDVVRSPDSDADRIIAGKRMEVKLSMLWEAGIFKFQQIRDQNYDYGICLGLSPFNAACWVVPKALLMERLPSQHGGSRGVDTKWLTFQADSPPDWLSPYGGTLLDAYGVLKAIEQLP